MPFRPRAACPTCRSLGPCDCRAAAHQAWDRENGSPAERGYGPSWQARRARQLEAEPWCRFHMRLGELVVATVADHVIARRALLMAGHPDPDGDWNLQSLCDACHAAKTNSEDGGFGRPVRPDTMARAQRATEAALATLAAIGAAQ